MVAMETHVEEIAENGKNKQQNSILDSFRNLNKDKDKVRIRSGAQLVKYLLENEHEETEFKYALGRLIRGLGSSTVSARNGFYSTLVGLLNFSSLTVSELFEHVEKELHKGKSNSKSENADISTGQLLVCTAIIKSDLFFKSATEDQTKVIDCLINAGKDKSYLLYPSYQLLIELSQKLNKDFEKIAFPLILEDLQKPWSDYNLDLLYLLLKLQEKFPKLIKKNILKPKGCTSAIINENNLKELAEILMNLPNIKFAQHPVYELFGLHIAKSKLTTQFVEILDGILQKNNRNRHLVTLKLLTIILENTENLNIIPQLFLNNLIQQTLTLFRQLSTGIKDNELKQLTYKFFEKTVEKLKDDSVEDQTKISLLEKLLFDPGTFIFEKITRSKLIQQITASLKTEGVQMLTKIYHQVILLENNKLEDGHFQNNDRLYATHLLVKLIGHPSMSEENSWKCEQLTFLMKLGLTKHPKIGTELAASIKETFFRSLDLKLPKLEDLSCILLQIFNNLDALIDPNDLENCLRFPITDEAYKIWCETKHLISKTNKKKVKKIKLVFQILFLHLGLQLFNDVKLASDSLEELFSCYKRIKDEKKTTGNEPENGDPAWIEVIIELFLSLLSHNSSLLRKIINCVFPNLRKYLNENCIQQILSVLDPNAEENPLEKHENNSDDEESEASENEEDVEDEGEDEDSESSNDSDEEENEESNTEKLRIALQSALSGNTAFSSDQSDLDLDEMDEEEGEQLNKVLGEVFGKFKPKKSQKQSKNDKALTHFRVRVTDLIEIYLDGSPSLNLVLEMLPNLLELLEFCIKDVHQKPLEDRVRSLLKKLTNLKKFEDVSNVSDENFITIFTNLLEKNNRNHLMTQYMAEEIANICSFLVKSSEFLVNHPEVPKKIKKSLKKKTVQTMKDSIEIFIKKRDCSIPFVIFKQILNINWIGNIQLAEIVTQFVFEHQVKPFRKSQCLDLLKIFYSNHRLLKNEEINCDFTVEFLTKIKEFLDSKQKVKEKFIMNLFNLLISIKNCPISTETFDWNNLGETIQEFRSSFSLNQETKRSYNKLCSCLNLTKNVQMKTKTEKLENGAEENDENIEVPTSKKSKKKKNKSNNNKLKKEAKEERLKSLSEGLENGDFSSLNQTGEVQIDELEDSTNGKRKNQISNGESKKVKRMKT